MKNVKWKEDFKELVKNITDNKDEDFVRCLLDEGLESEERAKELTQFIKENNIDCRGCFDLEDEQRYLDYKKLMKKLTENWEPVNEYYPPIKN